MTSVVHLKSLQALELAVRSGSLRAAADALGITPAAVGQRIRTLEDFLGTELLLRGRAGLRVAPELEPALEDLQTAFAALERAARTLDLRRSAEIHIVADSDWVQLWLQPRLAAFRADHPRVLFCINGEGDIPLRLGAPDLRIAATEGPGEPLFRDAFLPVSGPDNTRRIAYGDQTAQMEGMPLLHLRAQRDGAIPGWPAWFATFGGRHTGVDRGVTYPNSRLALQAMRSNVGFLVCGLSFVMQDLRDGTAVLPFPSTQMIPAPHPYRMAIRQQATSRPQLAQFIDWLRAESLATGTAIAALTAP
jgi:LysR family glycine cleavage system transcriptional activator